MPRSRMRGFSLIEMLIVLSVLLIVVGIGFINMQPALRQVRVTNAYNTTLMALRRAREAAIGQKRTYIVTFSNAAVPNTINIAPASVTPGGFNFTYSLPGDVVFTTIGGFPNPGPDTFGNGTTAIDFDQSVAGGDKKTVFFTPDGTAQDINSNINNGVVYLARPGELYSGTAITVWGATGRMRGWKLTNSGGPKWKQQ